MSKTAKVEITVIQGIINTGDNEWNQTIEDRVAGLTRKAYSWSKWGGVNIGLVQEKKTKEWSCQACGDRQSSDLPSYMFEVCSNEFIRICSICQAQKIAHMVNNLIDLTRLVRHHREMWD